MFTHLLHPLTALAARAPLPAPVRRFTARLPPLSTLVAAVLPRTRSGRRRLTALLVLSLLVWTYLSVRAWLEAYRAFWIEQFAKIHYFHRYNIGVTFVPRWSDSLRTWEGIGWGRETRIYMPPVQELLEAPWAGTWDVPVLERAVYGHGDGAGRGVSRWQEAERTVRYSPAAQAWLDALMLEPWHGWYTGPTILTPRELKTYSLLRSPALLRLHIFSTPHATARDKRHLLRVRHPLNFVHPDYRHLVEVKFVMGRQSPDLELGTEVETLRQRWGVAGDEEWWPDWLARRAEAERMEREIAMETEVYGDIVRLDGLKKGENMNEGKSLEWARWVGRGEGGRAGQWAVKCDDDTFVGLPHLLDLLLERNPREATYFGGGWGQYPGSYTYYEGSLYGFSHGVTKTLAAAQFNQSYIEFWFDEDARMGLLMHSLPSGPACQGRETKEADPTGVCDPAAPIAGYKGSINDPAPYRDPRTGLVRWDLKWRVGMGEWYRPGYVGMHGMKADWQYEHAYNREIAKQRERGLWRPTWKHRWLGEGGTEPVRLIPWDWRTYSNRWDQFWHPDWEGWAVERPTRADRLLVRLVTWYY